MDTRPTRDDDYTPEAMDRDAELRDLARHVRTVLRNTEKDTDRRRANRIVADAVCEYLDAAQERGLDDLTTGQLLHLALQDD